MTPIIIYERKKKRKNNLDRIESEKKTETWELKKDLEETLEIELKHANE